MRMLALIIIERSARVELLASTCTSANGAVRKAMVLLTSQARMQKFFRKGQDS